MKVREIEIPAGTSRSLEFNITYSADWSDAELRNTDIDEDDIDSATFLLKRRLTDADEDADLTKTDSDGIDLTDGKATVVLEPGDTNELSGDYYATLRLFLTSGAVVDFEDEDYQNIPYVKLSFIQGAVEAVD